MKHIVGVLKVCKKFIVGMVEYISTNFAKTYADFANFRFDLIMLDRSQVITG